MKSEDWKNDFLHEVSKFWSSRGAYEKLQIPGSFRVDMKKLSSLNDFILNMNRVNSALYFELNDSLSILECYGHRNVVSVKLDELLKRFPQLVKIDTTTELAKKPTTQTAPPPPPLPPRSSSNNSPTGSASYKSTNLQTIDLSTNGLIGFCLVKSPQLINDFK